PVAPAVMAVSSADIGGQTKTPRELDLARRVAQTSKHATEAAQNDWQYDKSRWHRQPDSCPRGGSRPPWSCGSQMLAGEIKGSVDWTVTTPPWEEAKPWPLPLWKVLTPESGTQGARPVARGEPGAIRPLRRRPARRQSTPTPRGRQRRALARSRQA